MICPYPYTIHPGEGAVVQVGVRQGKDSLRSGGGMVDGAGNDPGGGG
jgi:hypothetical protein